ncbi:MAG: HEAT repeat domain-containing protein, partial [Planctomycetes bacterium]|nr:HEAT repeat domain-containing protein [Planctomycetota bacterium]
MAEEDSPPDAGSAGASAHPPPPPKKSPPLWPLLLVAVAAVVVPFKFWYDTWMGRRLSDEDLREALADTEKPRRVQHGIEEMSRRIEENREKAREFYPLLLDLADHEEPVIRYHLAWVMGFDSTSEEFHAALVRLLADPALMVRQYAALSLSNFRDPACRPVLVSMLHPEPVAANRAGTVGNLLPSGTTVREGIELARVQISDSDGSAVRAPMPGRVESVQVEEGDEVSAG